MLLLFQVHPAPPAPVPGGSIAGWIWVGVVLALIVVSGVVLASRR